MLTFSLQSGSNGNCIYVEAGQTRLLFDAGISGITACQRMATYGRDIRDVDALFITHDHSDHIRCAGVFQRKFGLPLFITWPTLCATPSPLGKLTDVRCFNAGDTLQINDVTIHTLRTPHDAVDGVVFVVEHDRKRLGILTDLGHPFGDLQRLLPELDAAYIESNYDPHMLATGPYSPSLQQRVRGPGGHISNFESAELVRSATRRLKWASLAHLSAENNNPQLALDTHRRHVGNSFPLEVALRYGVSDMLTV